MRVTLAFVLLAAVLLPGCRVIDLKANADKTGRNSGALIQGFATLGFAEDPSFLKVAVFEGRSSGALFQFELWYLLRVEVGFVGVSVGVLPFDFGIGSLFYHPRSPSGRFYDWDSEHRDRNENRHSNDGRRDDEDRDQRRNQDDEDRDAARLSKSRMEKARRNRDASDDADDDGDGDHWK